MACIHLKTGEKTLIVKKYNFMIKKTFWFQRSQVSAKGIDIFLRFTAFTVFFNISKFRLIELML